MKLAKSQAKHLAAKNKKFLIKELKAEGRTEEDKQYLNKLLEEKDS